MLIIEDSDYIQIHSKGFAARVKILLNLLLKCRPYVTYMCKGEGEINCSWVLPLIHTAFLKVVSQKYEVKFICIMHTFMQLSHFKTILIKK